MIHIRGLRRYWFLVIGLTVITAAPLQAVMFDWPSAPGWTAGAPAPGQTATQNFTSVNPNDIAVAINNSGAGVQGVVWNAGSGGYPQIGSANDTGGFSGVNGLQLLVTGSQAFGNYIRVTVSFATPVANLSFQLWDVDAVPGQFIDHIANIQALAFGGGTVGANSVTSAVPGFNTVTGSGLGTAVLGTANAGNTTNQGTIDITFNGPITQFSFDWSNNDPALGAQGIALGPLTYLPVPEMDPSWLATATGIAAIGVELLRRRSRLTSRKHSLSL
jgi:hypothetical protein